MSTNCAAFMDSGEARTRPRAHVRHHLQRAIEVLDQPCQWFGQTIESLLGNSQIIDDGLGWVRPPFLLMVQEEVLENAPIANGSGRRITVPQQSAHQTADVRVPIPSPRQKPPAGMHNVTDHE